MELKDLILQQGRQFEEFQAKHTERLDIIEQAVARALGPGGGFSSGPRPGPFASLGEFGQAVAHAMRPGGRIDEKLLRIQAATGASEGVPADGGFLVQQDYNATLLKGLFDVSMIAARCNRLPISPNSNGIKLPLIDETSRANGSRWGGVQAYWAAEAATVTASRPKFRQAELSLHKLFGLCYVTDELLQDAPALGAVLEQAFREELAFKLDDAIFRGTGAGQPLGILNSGALVTVAKESGQAADTVLYENLVKMFSRMPARNRRNAVWFVNQEIEPQLFTMSLSVGTGGAPIFLPAGGASVAPFATLFNRPIVPIEQASALGDVGDILFADPTFYLLADKGGILSAMSIHLQFLTDEMAFRWILRADGQPMLASPITPYKGANPLSPFVTLAAR
jgi:HK97 family phage major capsid protein